MNKKKSIKILFVAAELTPLAKVGGLADVIGSLPKALKKLGVDVRIVIPNYGIIDPKKYPIKKIVTKVKVPFDGREELVDIYETPLLLQGVSRSSDQMEERRWTTKQSRGYTCDGIAASSRTFQKRCGPSRNDSKIPVYLIDHLKYLGQNGVYYNKDASSTGSITEAHRFIFFTRAVLEIFKPLKWQPDILCCHDWQTGLLTLLEKMWDLPYKTLFTIHNLAYQGHYNAKAVLRMLNLKEKDWPTLKIKDKWGNLVSLQQGILNADLINTVSPTYAKEILTKEYGCGMEKTLKKRKKDLCGILNGIDLEFWNPAIDSEIVTNYEYKNGVSSAAQRRMTKAKEENKIYLQKKCKLPINSKIPLIGLISRLTDQKGIDLIIKTFDNLMKLDFQFVLLGTGDQKMEKALKEKAKKYPQKFSIHLTFDAKLAQQIYAGSDMFLMPSRYEPCGLGQMISVRYGTIPIVRKTGGLADTIQNFDARKIAKMRKDYKATGFVFKKYKANEMLQTIKKALKIYQDKKIWPLLIIDAMEQDFSWNASAKKYLRLYKKLAS